MKENNATILRKDIMQNNLSSETVVDRMGCVFNEKSRNFFL
jgi:hypothetical protein